LFGGFGLVICLEHFEQARKRYVWLGVLGLFGCSAGKQPRAPLGILVMLPHFVLTLFP